MRPTLRNNFSRSAVAAGVSSARGRRGAPLQAVRRLTLGSLSSIQKDSLGGPSIGGSRGWPVLGRQRPRTITHASSFSDQDDGADTAEGDPNMMDFFLYWLSVNGATGLQEGDNAALFAENGDPTGDEHGTRGVVATATAEKGSEIMRVPIRLAVPDEPDEEFPLYPGAPWSVHLAARLLRHRAAGDECPWHAYIATLPDPMSTPLTYEWEEMQEIQYKAAEEELYRFSWLVSDSYQQMANGDSLAFGGATRDEWEWAMQVVHSRTLGVSRGSGSNPEEVGARLLVPQVDLLNHGGDEGPFSREPVTATDNVRWDVEVEDGTAAMVVRATRSIAEGDQLLLSYGERPNDHFFLYYGFVPLQNPHEDAVLFEDLPEALQWHLEAFGDQDADRRLAVAESAYQNCVRDIEATSDGAVAKSEPRLKVVAGSRVDARLVSAFAGMAGAGTSGPSGGGNIGPSGGALAAQHLAAAEGAAGKRCVQLLEQYPTSLEHDLAILAENASPERREHYASLLSHYKLRAALYDGLAGRLVGDRRESDPAPLPAPLSDALLAVVEYRAHKKMVLMDSAMELTGTAPPPGVASWEEAEGGDPAAGGVSSAAGGGQAGGDSE